jgi:hypothetical protein
MRAWGEKGVCTPRTGKENADLEVVLNGMSDKNAIFDELRHCALNLFEYLRWGATRRL